MIADVSTRPFSLCNEFILRRLWSGDSDSLRLEFSDTVLELQLVYCSGQLIFIHRLPVKSLVEMPHRKYKCLQKHYKSKVNKFNRKETSLLLTYHHRPQSQILGHWLPLILEKYYQPFRPSHFRWPLPH